MIHIAAYEKMACNTSGRMQVNKLLMPCTLQQSYVDGMNDQDVEVFIPEVNSA